MHISRTQKILSTMVITRNGKCPNLLVVLFGESVLSCFKVHVQNILGALLTHDSLCRIYAYPQVNDDKITTTCLTLAKPNVTLSSSCGFHPPVAIAAVDQPPHKFNETGVIMRLNILEGCLGELVTLIHHNLQLRCSSSCIKSHLIHQSECVCAAIYVARTEHSYKEQFLGWIHCATNPKAFISNGWWTDGKLLSSIGEHNLTTQCQVDQRAGER